MSFSSSVKEELYKLYDGKKECAYAELAAFFMFCGQAIIEEEAKTTIHFSTDNPLVSQKVFTLCKKNITMDVGIPKTTLVIAKKFPFQYIDWRNPEVYQESKCKRAFLRAAYLSAGSMSDPEKSYHLEFDCQTEEKALLLQQLIHDFDIEAKVVERKKYHVVYVKDGSAICDLLNIMGAHVSLMNFENYRILKEMRNSVNRKVNCETANIAKTVNAATKQVQDIMLIREKMGFTELPQGLREIAELRLEYQEATLQELGELLDPPVGKSGVNHRLRKLSEIAERMRA